MTIKLNYLQQLMAFICVSVTILSCSLNEADKLSNQDLNATLDYSQEASLIFDLSNRIESHFIQPNSPFRTAEIVDQESLNNYLGALDLESDYISLEDVNGIISELSQLEDEEDVEELIEQLPYTVNAKGYLNHITGGNAYENLNSIPGFSDLDISEKEIVALSNDILKEFQDRDPIDVPCPSEACTVSLMLAGAMLGGALCGLPCSIAGGVIGFLIGNSMKN